MNTKENLAFLTSGTGINYLNIKNLLLPVTQKNFSIFMKEAEVLSGIEQLDTKDFESDSLGDQLRNYCLNCALFEEIYEDNIKPQYVSGYSMGIYSALYAGGSICLKTGLCLIIEAFRCFKEATTNLQYDHSLMGSIIGLEEDIIESLIQETAPSEVSIANINNEHSIIISGPAEKVKAVLEKAGTMGALQAKKIEVCFPYHSPFLNKATRQFTLSLNTFKIEDLKHPFISTINQAVIIDAKELKKELAFNLSSKISWKATMLKLEQLGITNFVEISGSNTLEKIGRFINPNFKFYNYRKFHRLKAKTEVQV